MPLTDEEQEELLFKLKYAMWGFGGTNGIVSKINGLDEKFDAYVKSEEQRRQAESRDSAAERKRDIRWRVTTAIAIVGAILIAAGIVASAL